MRGRGFSIVLHDGHKGSQTKSDVIDFVKTLSADQAVVAQETYNHQEGWHVHVFYRLKNATSFKTVLKKWCVWWRSGRVQVDQMRGTIAQACRYVSKEETKKDKDCDPKPWCFPSDMIKIDPSEYADQWLTEWLKTDSQYHKYANNFATEWKKNIDLQYDASSCNFPVLPEALASGCRDRT